MKNILLTGGAGYIGSHVSELLLKKGYKITILDNLSTGSKKLLPPRVTFKKIDICDKKLMEKIFKKNSFDAVIHLAASLSVTESQKNPKKYYLNNIFGTQNLLDLCIEYKVKKFIFSSTCAVYGSVEGAVKENHKKKPESYYGKTKHICEELIQNYSKNYNLDYVILRYFNVIGASNSGKRGQLDSQGLFKSITKTLKVKKNEVTIFGNDYNTRDGTCIRDYIDVNDLSDLHFQSLKTKKAKNKIINCGYNKGYTVKEIVGLFSTILNKKIKIKYSRRRAGDVVAIYSNNRYMKTIFPKWKRSFGINKSIENTLNWEKISI